MTSDRSANEFSEELAFLIFICGELALKIPRLTGIIRSQSFQNPVEMRFRVIPRNFASPSPIRD